MTGTDLLKRVRRDLLEIGWHQGDYGNPETGMCLSGWLLHEADDCAFAPTSDGSIVSAERVGWTYFDATAALLAVAPRRAIPMFNDCPGRTLAEIVDWVDRAIAYLEATSVEETLTPALA